MALTKKLEAIGDSIRSKTGSTEKMTLDEMKNAIDGIGSVPAPPDEAFIISGDCTYMFYSNSWNWFIKTYGDKIITKDITKASNMFFNNTVINEIPFDINLKDSGGNMSAAFRSSYISKPPYIKGKVSQMDNIFYGCYCLTEIPEDWGDYIDLSIAYANIHIDMSDIFSGCASLRKIPNSLLCKLHNERATGYYYKFYNSAFSGCFVLDEIHNIPIDKANMTSNMFSSFVSNCGRLKGITFATNEDGTVQIANWKSQIIDLSTSGYHQYDAYIINQSKYHGITKATRVTDDASYQALKDNPDWWTTDVAYSRYNHDSAVETINSLPDTSAYLAANGGTNTIKFKGAAGSKTDGGAINTLTEEEIAVAAAKGWTVTLV